MRLPASFASAPADVWRLAAATGLTNAGRNATYTVLLFALYARTHSSWWVSVALFLLVGAGVVTSPWAGSLGDRFDRRAVVAWSGLAAGACFVATAAAAWAGSSALMTVAAAAGIVAMSPVGPAIGAAVPNLVPAEALSSANGLVGAARSAGYMLGPGLGGALVAVLDPAAVFLVVAALFAGGGVTVTRVRGRLRGEAGPAEDAADVWRGFRTVAADPFLRRLVGAWMLVLIGLGPVLVAELQLVAQFDVGALGYGALGVCWDGGAIVGALAAQRMRADQEARAVVYGPAGVALGFLAVALSPVFWPVLAGMLFSGGMDAWAFVAEQNITQRRVADELRSRTLAAVEGAMLAAMTLSYLFGAPLVELVGAQGTYAVAAAAAAAGALVLLPLTRPGAAGAPLTVSSGPPPA